MTDFSRMTALVYDRMLFPYMATTLAKSFGRVLYFAPQQADPFPIASKALWGSGLPNVERVPDFEDHIDAADVIVFPDNGHAALQMYLRQHGYNVWGSAASEQLELDREALKRLQDAEGWAIPNTWLIRGVDALRAHFEDPANDHQFVKLPGRYRGDAETHEHKNLSLSEPWLRYIEHRLWSLRDDVIFVIEGSIPNAIEVGYDGICIDGQFPRVTMYGYENKDVAYLGRVCAYNDLPPVLQDVNAQLAPALNALGCRSMFSTEVRVTEDGTGFLIDPTLRCGSPPSESMLEIFSNWADIIYEGAAGDVVDPIPVAKFAAQLVLRSDWADEDRLALSFPEEMRHLVKLHGHAIIDGVDHVVAVGMDIIGSAVGLGETAEEAMAQATEVAKAIEGHDVTFDEHAFEVIKTRITDGEDRGISWD